jgi:hypothetical protein
MAPRALGRNAVLDGPANVIVATQQVVEYLDLRAVGLGPDMLGYLNQAEADVMLERLAAAFESAIRDWREGQPSCQADSGGEE